MMTLYCAPVGYNYIWQGLVILKIDFKKNRFSYNKEYPMLSNHTPMIDISYRLSSFSKEWYRD